MPFITIQGEQLIAQKQGANQVMTITHFVFANIPGLGAEPVDRIETMPPVGQIVHEHAVSKQGYVNANQVVYSCTLESTIGNFTFNWVGLKAAAGELVACAHISAQVKTANAGAIPGNNLTRNFLLAFSGIAATTAISVPAETWQIDFTTRLLQIDERERLSNFDIYGVGAFFGDGFKVEYVSGTTYKVKAGIGYVGGIRCLLAADVNITLSAPKGVWIDASLQGDINGVAEIVQVKVSATALVNSIDSNGFAHYLSQVANVATAGVVTDLRAIAPVYLRRDDVVPQAEAEAGTATTARAWNALRVKQAIQALVLPATESLAGLVRRATIPEILAGLNTLSYVSPAGLAAENTRARIIEKIGWPIPQQGTGINQLANAVKIGWSAEARLKATVDVTDIGNFVFDQQLENAPGLLIGFSRKEYASYYDVDSSIWEDVPTFSLQITVTKAPVIVDVFARIYAHFNHAPDPAFCRILVNGGEFVNFVVDRAIEEGLIDYTIGQSFVLHRKMTLSQNANYTFKVQMRNSANSPTQNVRLGASDENQVGPTAEYLSTIDIGMYKA